MKISNVCMLGGSGFVGHAIAEQLSALGTRVRVVTRRQTHAQSLTVLPTVEVMEGNVHDPASLRRCFDNMDAVVNLVGILHESRRQTFQACHVDLPRKVVEACRATGVRHLLHMSALGAAEDGPSQYLRTKAAGEAAVRQGAGILPYTIFRPSVIFGEGDRFLNLFAQLVRAFPVIPLAGAGARFQPVWVEDVGRAFAQSAGDPRTFGQVYELGGPKVYTLAELVGLVAATLGRSRRVVALPPAIGNLQAAVMERLPGKLMTRDNLRSMSVDNVCSAPWPEVFGFQPSPIEAIVPEYLAGTTGRARFSRFRYFAGR